MTLVDTTTGELIETLSESEARRLTDRIRLMGESVADQLDKMADLIDQARVGSAWLALGYRSWPEYVAEEFVGILPRLNREPRQEFVRELAARGMSTRAIAPVVGVSNKTVSVDLRSPVTEVTPEDAPGGAPTPEGEEKAPATLTAVEPEPHPVQAAQPRPPVVGIDGKTYAPRPHRELAEVIDSDTSIQDSRYVAALTKQLREVAAVHQFDPERVAALADDLTMTSIEAAFDNFTKWHDRIVNKRGGLRVIQGGAE